MPAYQMNFVNEFREMIFTFINKDVKKSIVGIGLNCPKGTLNLGPIKINSFPGLWSAVAVGRLVP